jgi:hypothetical protein
MTADPFSADASVQARFAWFARQEAPEEPLYTALAAAAAANADWAALLEAAPREQRLPVLWLAALHDRLLERVEQGERPPLADWYPSAGGTRAPDEALVSALADFIERERPALRERIATRTTQTNEIGRCAVLWPILRALAARTGRGRIALLDVGCSAGLNLGVDRWGYRYVDGAGATLAQFAGAPEIACRVAAGSDPLPVEGPAPRLVSRLGIDLNPVAVDDAAAVRWLRACLWPHDTARRARFDAALEVARAERWPVRATRDAVESVGEWLDALPADVLPVVVNTWVLAYFDADARARYADRLRQWVAGRGVAWVSAEWPALARGWWPRMPAPRAPGPGERPDARELEEATAWTVAHADGRGGAAWWLAARSHAHGRWLQWTA